MPINLSSNNCGCPTVVSEPFTPSSIQVPAACPTCEPTDATTAIQNLPQSTCTCPVLDAPQPLQRDPEVWEETITPCFTQIIVNMATKKACTSGPRCD
jgi:hypothetical protein